ncbi:hypothetical protein J6Q66_02325 [bacterium]|nr:hypothetical protein [bacterium]
MNKNEFIKLPAILDKEIDNIDKDKFGHIHFAEILATYIKEHDESYSIALLGDYGVGKSTIKALCKQYYLESSKFKIIDFNAWRYESSNIRECLLKEIYTELGGEEEHILTKLFRQVSKMFEKNLPYKEAFKNFFISIRLNIAIIFIHVLISIFFCWLVNICLLHLIFRWQILFLFLPIYIITYHFLKNPFEYISSKFPRYFKETITELPIKKDLEYEDLIAKQLKKFTEKHPFQKIVVFIDDLDRLPAAEMVNGLNALRVFLELKNSKMVFVISCNEAQVAEAINSNLEIKNARRFLDKVFQFKIEIPSIHNQSMNEFAKNCLEQVSNINVLKNDLKKSNLTLDSLIDILIPLEINSPRLTIQILNQFLQYWWLAKRREEQCDKCDKEKDYSICKSKNNCLLIKNIISGNLGVLATISVLKTQFPDFYEDLLKCPELLQFILLQYFEVNGYSIVKSKVLESMFSKYIKVEYIKNKDFMYGKEEKEIMYFKEGNESLETYLALIQKINIPDDLSPYLKFAQGPLERAIGEEAIEIYKTLITNNQRKLENLLGIDIERKNITDKQTRQLQKIKNEIRQKYNEETVKESSYMLLSIIDLFQGEPAADLANELSEEFCDKRMIRRVSDADINKILASEYVNKQNKNNFFAMCVNNLAYRYHFLGEENNKEHECNHLKTIIECGLDLRYKKGILNEENHKILINIINDRKYKFYIKGANNEEDKIDFAYIKKLVLKYGNELILDLGYPYAIDILGNNPLPHEDNSLTEISIIINSTVLNDEDSIRKYELINKGLSHNNINILDYFVAYTKNENNINNMNVAYIAELIDSYTQRIIKHYSTNKLDNIGKHIGNLVTIINKYEILTDGEIDTLISPNIEKLIDLVLHNEAKDIFEQLFEVYGRLFSNESNKILNDLTGKIFLTDSIEEAELISEQVMELLIKKYFNNSQFENIVEVMSELFEDYTIDIDDFNLNRYKILLSNLKSELVQNVKLVSHISRVYKNLEASLSNEEENYFENLISTILPFFDKIKTNSLNSLLSFIIQNYLTDDNSETEKFYTLMKNYWPQEESDLLPSYSLLKIMQSGEKLIESVFKGQSSLNAKLIYESIYSIYERKLVPQNTTYKKILVGCLFDIWKNDIQYAHDNLLPFIEIACSNFLYEVLCLRNSTQNPTLLANIWGKCVNIDSKDRLIDKTKKFLYDSSYSKSVFKTMWFNAIKNKEGNLSILASALELISDEKELDTFISGKEVLIKIFLKEFNETEQTILGKSLLNLYKKTSNGTKNRKRSIALMLRDLIGINGSHLLNASTLKDCPTKDIIRLSKIFTANLAITRLINKLVKTKKSLK